MMASKTSASRSTLVLTTAAAVFYICWIIIPGETRAASHDVTKRQVGACAVDPVASAFCTMCYRLRMLDRISCCAVPSSLKLCKQKLIPVLESWELEAEDRSDKKSGGMERFVYALYGNREEKRNPNPSSMDLADLAGLIIPNDNIYFQHLLRAAQRHRAEAR